MFSHSLFVFLFVWSFLFLFVACFLGFFFCLFLFFLQMYVRVYACA